MCHPVSSSVGLARQHEHVGVACRRTPTAGRSCVGGGRGCCGSLRSCTTPNAALISRRLEVPADLVEDEEVVVLDAVDLGEEALVALLRAVDLRLGPPAPAAQQQAAVDELVVVEQHHPAGAAAVMMCERAKLVTLMSRARARSACRGAWRPSASHESSITVRPWASAMARMRSQSGQLPIRFGHEDRLRARRDHRLDARRRRCCTCRAPRRRTRARCPPAPAARCRSRT